MGGLTMEDFILDLARYTNFVKKMDPNLSMSFQDTNQGPIVNFKFNNIEQGYRMDSGNNFIDFVLTKHADFMRDLANNHLSEPGVQEVIFGK
jgi:hypothetical protein